MAKLNVAPTKSNLLAIKEQLAISTEGYFILMLSRHLVIDPLISKILIH